MKAPIKNIPPELNRRLDDLENVSAEVDIDAIIQAVLAQIVIPEAEFPEGLNQQFLIYKAGAEGWQPSYIDDFRVRGTLFVNSDYVTGDEDATIDFNDGEASLTYDYGTGSNEAFALSRDLIIDTGAHGTVSALYWRDRTTEMLWDNSNNRFRFSDPLHILGTYLWIGPGTAGDCSLSFYDGGFHSLKWINSGAYYEFTGGSPLYLTGTDLRINHDYISGDYDCKIYFNDAQASLKWDYGEYRFEFDQKVWISDSLTVSGQTTCGAVNSLGLLEGENIRATDNISINYDYTSGDIDSVLYFEAEAQNFRWDHGNSRFELSADLYVNGAISSAGLGGDDPVCHANAVVCHSNEVMYN